MRAPAFRHDEPGTAASAWHGDPRWAALPVPVALTAADAPSRLVVLAAHPDDESLGAGGAVAYAAGRGRAVEVVILTDGEASHPASPTHSPPALAARRRKEAFAAAQALGAGPPRLLGYPDGSLADTLDTSEEEDGLVARLVDIVGDGRDTVLLAPWRHDGHPDHEAAGRAAAACAVRTGARLLEYPVWAWHWGDPADAPWDQMVALPLDSRVRQAKADAVAAHSSQVEPLSALAGDETLLGPDLLAHTAGDREVYVCEPPEDLALDELHQRCADPWGAERTWYEERKRTVTTAMLPRRRYARALEVGCSLGHLARDLAARCEELVAVDRSQHAIAGATQVVPDGVQLQQMDVPRQWPEGTFDLIVLSEVGYFFSPVDLDATLALVRTTLAPGGTVLLGHWRHPIAGWPLDGPRVHRRASEAGLPPVRARYVDHDIEIVVHAQHGPAPGA